MKLTREQRKAEKKKRRNEERLRRIRGKVEHNLRMICGQDCPFVWSPDGLYHVGRGCTQDAEHIVEAVGASSYRVVGDDLLVQWDKPLDKTAGDRVSWQLVF